MKKLLNGEALLAQKVYSLHVFLKPSTSKEQIEKETNHYISQLIMENSGAKVYNFDNHGKVDLYYPIKKNTSALHYSWNFEINKSFMDIKTENLGTRLARIQRKFKEKYENDVLRIMLLS